MTTNEQHTRQNQLAIRIIELQDALSEPENEETMAKVLAANAKIAELAKQFDKLLAEQKELEKIIAEQKENETFSDAGKLFLLDLKAEIRGLSVQTGEIETEEENRFLSRQLSFLGPDRDDVKYLKSLKRRLQERRQGMFLLGSLDPDSPQDSKKAEYETGRHIGQGGSKVIQVH